jgi:Ca-activated chloride channel family protein
MKFALPQFLYALPVVWLLLALLLGQVRKRRRVLLEKFVGANSPAWADTGVIHKRRLWDRVLLFVAVTALFVTLARPLYFQFDERSELQGASYLIALDASRSMLAGDLKPTRYTAVTNALDKFFADTRADRIGLITFAGIGYLNAPLTYDTRALRTILSYINPMALSDPGSSMASAMDRAARFFTSNALPQRTLILVTDGEELDGGKALELARKLKRDHQITIHTIGVGTATGARIPAYRATAAPAQTAPMIFQNGVFIQPTAPPAAQPPSNAPDITTRLDENNLRRVANAGGGRYYRLGQNGEGLRQLREEVLRPLAEKTARGDLQNYREGFFVPLAIAILALAARVWLGAERFARRRVLPSILGAIE